MPPLVVDAPPGTLVAEELNFLPAGFELTKTLSLAEVGKLFGSEEEGGFPLLLPEGLD